MERLSRRNSMQIFPECMSLREHEANRYLLCHLRLLCLPQMSRRGLCLWEKIWREHWRCFRSPDVWFRCVLVELGDSFLQPPGRLSWETQDFAKTQRKVCGLTSQRWNCAVEEITLLSLGNYTAWFSDLCFGELGPRKLAGCKRLPLAICLLTGLGCAKIPQCCCMWVMRMCV